MLIVCVTITKFKPTPAVKWQESQCWQRGKNGKGTGEEVEQLPQKDTAAWPAPCVTPRVLREDLNPSFLGENVNCHTATSVALQALAAVLLGTECIVTGERLSHIQTLSRDAGCCRTLFVCPCHSNIQLFCQPGTHSTRTTRNNYAYCLHIFRPKIRFLLITITKAVLWGNYFGIGAILVLLFVRKLMISFGLLSRWTI